MSGATDHEPAVQHSGCVPGWPGKNKPQGGKAELIIPDVFQPSDSGDDDRKLDAGFNNAAHSVVTAAKAQTRDALKTTEKHVRTVRAYNLAFKSIWADWYRTDEKSNKQVVPEVDFCLDALSGCLESMKEICQNKEGVRRFVSVLFLSQVALNIITTLYFAAEKDHVKGKNVTTLKEAKRAFPVQIRQLRSSFRSVFRKLDVPLGALNLVLSRMELGLTAVQNPDEKRQGARAVGKLVVGLAQSALAWRPDPLMVEGLSELASLGGAKLRQNQAKHVFQYCAYCELMTTVFQRQLFELYKSPENKRQATDQQSSVEDMAKHLLLLQQTVMKESRWEVIASFVDTLAYTLLGDGSMRRGHIIHDRDLSLLKLIIMGEDDAASDPTKHQGLIRLAALGEEPSAKERIETRSDVPLYALERWGSSMSDLMTKKEPLLDGDSVQQGVDLVQTQIEFGMQTMTQHVHKVLNDISDMVQDEISKQIQQMVRMAMVAFEKGSAKTTTTDPPGEAPDRKQELAERQRMVDLSRKWIQKASVGLDNVRTRAKNARRVATSSVALMATAEDMASKSSSYLEILLRMLPADSASEGSNKETVRKRDVDELALKYWQTVTGLPVESPHGEMQATASLKLLQEQCMEATALLKLLQSHAVLARGEEKAPAAEVDTLIDLVTQLYNLRNRFNGEIRVYIHHEEHKKTVGREMAQLGDKTIEHFHDRLKKLSDLGHLKSQEIKMQAQKLSLYQAGDDVNGEKAKKQAAEDPRSRVTNEQEVKHEGDVPLKDVASNCRKVGRRITALTGTLAAVKQRVGAMDKDFDRFEEAVQGVQKLLGRCREGVVRFYGSIDEDAPQAPAPTDEPQAPVPGDESQAPAPEGEPRGSLEGQQAGSDHGYGEDAMAVEALFRELSAALQIFDIAKNPMAPESTSALPPPNAVDRDGPGQPEGHNDKHDLTGPLGSLAVKCTLLLSDCSRILKDNRDLLKGGELNFRTLSIRKLWKRLKGAAGELDVHEKTAIGKEALENVKDEVEKVKEELAAKAAEQVGNILSEVSLPDVDTSELDNILEDSSGVLNGMMEFGMGVFSLVKNNSQSKSRKELWRVRDRAVFQLMAISAALKNKPPQTEPAATQPQQGIPNDAGDPTLGEQATKKLDEYLKEVEKAIGERRVFEQHAGVKKTMQCETFVQLMQQVVSEGLEDREEQLRAEVHERLQLVIEMEDKLMLETDTVKKEAILIALHKERAALKKILENVTELHTKFNVLQTTMDQMSKQLEVINTKLDFLTDQVKELQQNMQHLVGLPPLFVLDEYRKELRRKGQNKRDEVYIEPHCKGSNDELLRARVERFLDDRNKACLLVSGRAGSGKSVFASKLEQYILGPYYDKRERQSLKRAKGNKDNGAENMAGGDQSEPVERDKAGTSAKVVLIWANLPTLKNPLTGLFEEALEQRYHFIQPQVRRLRSLILDPKEKIEVVFVLDAYDELRPEFLNRNLYKTNNLESYRNPDSSPVNPKVVIFCRQELLSGIPNFENQFLPVQSIGNDEAVISRDGMDLFEHVEIGLLDSTRFSEYAREYVSLQVMRRFETLFPNFKLQAHGRNWAEDKEPQTGLNAVDMWELLFRGLTKTLRSRMWFGVMDQHQKQKPQHAKQRKSTQAPRLLKSLRKKQYSSDTAAQFLKNFSSFAAFVHQQRANAAHQASGRDIDDLELQLRSLAHSLAAPMMDEEPLDLFNQSLDDVLVVHKLKKATHAAPERGEADTSKREGEISQDGLPIDARETAPQLPGAIDASFALKPRGKATDTEPAVFEDVLRPKAVRDHDTVLGFRMMFDLLLRLSSVAEDIKDKKKPFDEERRTFLQEVKSQKLSTADEIVREYNKLPELSDLTKTPFMIKIVVQILPFLKDLSPTLSSVKQEIILRLSKERVSSDTLHDTAWATLHEFGLVKSDASLALTQVLVEVVNEHHHHHHSQDESVENIQKELKKRFNYFLTDLVKKAMAQQIQQGPDSLITPTRHQEVEEVNVLGYVRHQISLALMRKPVRRFLVYFEFIKRYSGHEHAKGMARAGGVAPDRMQQELWEFSSRLAVKMTSDGLSKVTYFPGSMIFSQIGSDEWHPFFGVGDQVAQHRDEVRRGTPLKASNGTYSFVHKSVQEFFVAAAIRDSVVQLVRQTLITPPELKAMFDRARDPTHNHADFAISEPPTPAAGREIKLLDASAEAEQVAAGDEGVLRICEELVQSSLQDHDLRGGKRLQGADRRRISKSLFKLVQGLCDGPLHIVDLTGEEAIRDFLVDTLLDDMHVAWSVAAVASLCLAWGRRDDKMKQVAENLKALFILPLPKRGNSTLVHQACTEGNIVVLEVLLEFCFDRIFSADLGARMANEKALLLAKKGGKSPFGLALDSRNWSICRLLLDHCHDEASKEEMIMDCESRKFQMTLLDEKELKNSGADVLDDEEGESEFYHTSQHKLFMYECGNKIGVETGMSFWQVKLDPKQLRVRDHFESGIGFGGRISIGFASGQPPKSRDIVEHFERYEEDEDKGGRVETFVAALKEKEGRVNDEHLQREWKELTNRRLRTCPFGGAETQGFRTAVGVALDICEPYVDDAAAAAQNSIVQVSANSFEVLHGTESEHKFSELQLFPMVQDTQTQKGPLSLVRSVGPSQPLDQSEQHKRKQSSSFEVDFKRSREPFYLGLALDFSSLHNNSGDNAMVFCTWLTGIEDGASAEWIPVGEIPKSEAPLFPVVCSWCVDSRPEIEFGLKETALKVHPPREGFLPLAKVVKGRPGHFNVAKGGEWDLFDRLLEMTKEPRQILSYLDPDTGATLLHSLVEENDETNVREFLHRAQRILKQDQESNDGTGHDMEEIVCAKDLAGYSAFSLVQGELIATKLLCCVGPQTRALLMQELVDRLYEQTKALRKEDTEQAKDLKERFHALSSSIRQMETGIRDLDGDGSVREKDDVSEILSDVMRRSRKIKENITFCEYVLAAFSSGEVGDRGAFEDADSVSSRGRPPFRDGLPADQLPEIEEEDQPAAIDDDDDEEEEEDAEEFEFFDSDDDSDDDSDVSSDDSNETQNAAATQDSDVVALTVLNYQRHAVKLVLTEHVLHWEQGGRLAESTNVKARDTDARRSSQALRKAISLRQTAQSPTRRRTGMSDESVHADQEVEREAAAHEKNDLEEHLREERAPDSLPATVEARPIQDEGMESVDALTTGNIANEIQLLVLPVCGRLLRNVSADAKGRQAVARVAVHSDFRAMQYAGDALKDNFHFFESLLYEPEEKSREPERELKADLSSNDKEFVKIQVSMNGMWLQEAGHFIGDPDVVLAAVQSNGRAIKFASPLCRADLDIMIHAVRNGGELRHWSEYSGQHGCRTLLGDGRALKYCSSSLRANRDAVLSAIDSNGLSLKYAPRYQDDFEVVKMAVQRNGMALQFADESLRKLPEIVELAVRENGLALQFAGEITDADRQAGVIRGLIRAAVQQDGLALEYAVAKDFLKKYVTLDVAQAAVEQTGRALQFVLPDLGHLVKKEDLGHVIRSAVGNDPAAMLFVPLEEEDIICELARENVRTLQFVPLEVRRKLLDAELLLQKTYGPREVFDNLHAFEDGGFVSWCIQQVEYDSISAAWSAVVFSTQLLFDQGLKHSVELCKTWADCLQLRQRQPSAIEVEQESPDERLITRAVQWKESSIQDNTADVMAECWLHLVAILKARLDYEKGSRENEGQQQVEGRGEVPSSDSPEESAEQPADGMPFASAAKKKAFLAEKFGTCAASDSEIRTMELALHRLIHVCLAGKRVHPELMHLASEESRKNRALVENAVMHSRGKVFQFVHKSLQDDVGLAEMAIKLHPMALEHLHVSGSEYLRLAELAIQSDPLALQFVDENKLDCEHADAERGKVWYITKKNQERGETFFQIRNLRGLATLACQQNGSALEFAKYVQNIKMCEVAVKRTPAAFAFVETKWQEALRTSVLKANGSALQYFPDEIKKDEESVLIAVSNDGNALQFAHLDQRKNPTVIEAAVKQTGLALQYVASEKWINNMSKARVLEIVKQHGAMLEFAPHLMLDDDDVVTAAVRSDVTALQFVHRRVYINDILFGLCSRKRFSFELPKSLILDQKEVSIDLENQELTFREMTTVICPHLVAIRGCKFYYEIELLEAETEAGECYFGFADQNFSPQREIPVGSDENSWAIDEDCTLWNSGRNAGHDVRDAAANRDPAINRPASLLRKGTVIGIGCEPAKGTISFWVNGSFVRRAPNADTAYKTGYKNAFEDVRFIGLGLFPAISGQRIRVRYRFWSGSDLENNKFQRNPLHETHNMALFFSTFKHEEPAKTSTVTEAFPGARTDVEPGPADSGEMVDGMMSDDEEEENIVIRRGPTRKEVLLDMLPAMDELPHFQEKDFAERRTYRPQALPAVIRLNERFDRFKYDRYTGFQAGHRVEFEYIPLVKEEVEEATVQALLHQSVSSPVHARSMQPIAPPLSRTIVSEVRSVSHTVQAVAQVASPPSSGLTAIKRPGRSPPSSAGNVNGPADGSAVMIAGGSANAQLASARIDSPSSRRHIEFPIETPARVSHAAALSPPSSGGLPRTIAATPVLFQRSAAPLSLPAHPHSAPVDDRRRSSSSSADLAPLKRPASRPSAPSQSLATAVHSPAPISATSSSRSPSYVPGAHSSSPIHLGGSALHDPASLTRPGASLSNAVSDRSRLQVPAIPSAAFGAPTDIVSDQEVENARLRYELALAKQQVQSLQTENRTLLSSPQTSAPPLRQSLRESADSGGALDWFGASNSPREPSLRSSFPLSSPAAKDSGSLATDLERLDHRYQPAAVSMERSPSAVPAGPSTTAQSQGSEVDPGRHEQATRQSGSLWLF